MHATRLPLDHSSAEGVAAARLFALGVAILCSVWPAQAQAYLDPLTGSILIQALVGTVLGALFAVKVYWRKIKAYFTGRPVEAADSSPERTLTKDEH